MPQAVAWGMCSMLLLWLCKLAKLQLGSKFRADIDVLDLSQCPLLIIVLNGCFT